MISPFREVERYYDDNIALPDKSEEDVPSGVWITADGRTEEVEPENGTDFSLEELQGYISSGISDPVIDVKTFPDKSFMVVHDEGHSLGLPVNALVTSHYRDLFGGNDIIVGDVLFVAAGKIK